MTCPTVIRVTTKTGPPGIGLPAGSAQQDGFAVVKDGASPYLYKLVEIGQVGLPQVLGITASPTFAGLTLSGLQAQAQGLAVVGINGQIQRASIGSGLAIQNGALVVTISGGGSGTVTSVGLSVPAGFSVSGSPVTGSGVLSFSFADGYSLPTTAKQQQWDTASGLAASAIQEGDSRLSNSREWSAETISKAEAEEGTSTTRRAFSSLRVRENVSAWWQAVSGATGKLLAAANTQADARTALGLGTAATSATTDFATPSALATGLAGKADLVGGVIPSSQIPSIAISAYLGAVGSQSAMLALSGEVGDWCIRTDGLPNTGAWILSGNDPSSLSNWVKIPLPDVPVQSVNGQAGNIVLSPGDIGAATAAQGAKADSAIQPGDPALSDAREWSASTIDEAEAAAGTATTRRAFNALRVRQAISGWWQTVASTVGQSLVGAADAQTARSTIGAAASGAITTSGVTMTTARLLGRTTAGSGAVEEIQVSGGSLEGGVLTLDSAITLPGYGVGVIITPYDAQVAIGNAMTANIIYLTPFAVKKAITVDQLLFRVTTGVAGSSFQYAIYGSNGVLPTGNPIISSGNLSSSGSTIISHSAFTPFTLLSSQIYWTAINVDTTGVGMQTLTATSTNTLNLIGADFVTLPLATNAHVIRQVSPATFGTWPNLANTTSSLARAQLGAIPYLRISAIP